MDRHDYANDRRARGDDDEAVNAPSRRHHRPRSHASRHFLTKIGGPGAHSVDPDLDDRPRVDRSDVTSGNQDDIQDNPHPYFLLKMAESTETTNAPIEPLDGRVIDGDADRRIDVDVRASAELTGE